VVGMKILSRAFWEAATERALKTAGQTGGFALGTVVFTNVDQVIDGFTLVGLGALFGLVSSYLTSLASANVGNAGPSLANEILTEAAE
jgi:hypothetical protein